MIHLLGDWSAFAGAATSLAFVVLYHLSAPWWRSAEGRHLMSFTASLALMLSWVSYRITVTTPGPLPLSDEIVRTVVYALIAGLLLWRLALLWRRQIGPGLRRRKEPR